MSGDVILESPSVILNAPGAVLRHFGALARENGFHWGAAWIQAKGHQPSARQP